MSFRRRDVLRIGAVASVGAAASGIFAAASRAATPSSGTAVGGGAADLAGIITAYRELQVGSGQDSAARRQAVAALDQVAAGFNATMNVASDQLWADLPTGPGSTYFPMMYYRLRTIAVAWGTPGSATSAIPGLADRIRTALRTLYTVQYNEGTAEIGNWYVYEIGVPYWLLQIMVAMGGELPAADLATYLRPVLRFVANPNIRTATPGLVETGANRADKSLITVVSGALAGDAARVATGVAAVTDVAGGGAASLVARVTSGDGYHTDGSFIQHGDVPYTGHYALVLLTAMAGLIRVMDGTSSGLSPDVRQKFYDTVTDVYAPFVFAGSMMEPVRGRMLSRQGETGHDAGHQLTASVVLLARTAPDPERGRLAGLAAQWIADDTWAPYLQVSDLSRFAGGLQPVGVPEVEYAEAMLASQPTPPPGGPVHRAFPQMDRMTHGTGAWSASLGLSSDRICRYEAINGQNLHGWYVGDGTLYTFLPADQGHYSDAYWPTVDAALLPGTTEADVTPPTLQVTPPLTSGAFAGGASYRSTYGAYGLDFTAQDGTVSAKKSWFFTPEAVVCLGSGITGASGASVRTTIENRNIGENGTATLLVDGNPGPVSPGQQTVVPARWLHLDGVGGYALLGDASVPVTLLREDRTGTWLSIDTGANTHGTNTPYTRRYQKIVLDHGASPSGARYAYAVLPGASPARTEEATTDLRVLANTPTVAAALLHAPSGLTGAVFFAGGTLSAPGPLGDVTVTGPACVLWGRTGGGSWAVTLADPTQVGSVVRLTFSRPGYQVSSTDPAVTVVASGTRVVVDVAVGGTLGASHGFALLPAR